MTSSAIAALATDPEAFDEFYRAHVEDVSAFVSRRVADPHSAADLTADVFLVAIERAHTVDASRGSPRMWLFGIARTVVADDFRRSDRHRRAVARLGGRRLIDTDAYQAVLDRLDAERESRVLHRRIATLPTALRQVAELIGLDGLDVTEASQVLGLRPSTTRVRLHRARRRLGLDDEGPPGKPPAPAVPRRSAPPALLAQPRPTPTRRSPS